MMRLLPAALLLSAATALATEDRPSSAAGRRALATVDHASVRQPKNLGIINDRFDSMANSAHQAVSKLAAEPHSNDDPEIQKLLLELLSVTINGTTLTRSPTPPSSPTSPTSSAPLAPSAASPAPPEAVTGASEPNAIATGAAENSEGIPPNDAGSSPVDALVPSPTPVDDQADPTSPRTTTSSTLLAPSSISATSTKATATASSTVVGEDEAGDGETYSPTAVMPTYAPSPSISSKAPSAHTSANAQHDSDGGGGGGCPPEFDESKQYQEGDRVSLKRNRRCRTGRCNLIYQCKPWPESAYCSLVPPRKSDKGWLMVGRCADNEVPADAVTDASSGAADGSEHEDALAENGTAALSNTTHEDATNELAAENATLSSNATSHVPSQSNASSVHKDDEEEGGHLPSASSPTAMLPTPSPTPKQQFAYSPIWAKPSTSDLGISTDVDPATSILVNLPRIICDITLSSSLSQSFESNRVLIAAMTHMIYTMFDQHLPKSLYELAGISLSVEVKNNGIEATESPTVRIHAFFSGVASFSLQGAPSANDLITLLIRYFDVDAFNLLLRQGPLKASRLRTAKSQADEIKVNSVFFTLEDGSLVLAGSTYEENKLPAPTKAIVPAEQKGSRAEITLVILALIGMACVLALVAFLLYSNKMKDNEDEDNVALASTDDLPASDAQSRIAQGAPGSVEIEVPSTPQFAVSDISDDDMHSRVSTLSESPFPTKSPPFWSHPGLGQPAVATPTNLVGATNPSSYCHVGDGNLEETWQHPQSTKWELYKDPSTVGSL